MPRRLAVVLFPPARATSQIEAFRRDHDDLHARIRAHVTLVFPFPGRAPDARRRLAPRLAQARGFPVALAGAGRYADGTVYLRVASGAREIAALHRSLTDALPGAAARAGAPAYRAHVTVARAADPAWARRLTRAAAAVGRIEFATRAVSLIAEDRAGRWRTVARFALRPRASGEHPRRIALAPRERTPK